MLVPSFSIQDKWHIYRGHGGVSESHKFEVGFKKAAMLTSLSDFLAVAPVFMHAFMKKVHHVFNMSATGLKWFVKPAIFIFSAEHLHGGQSD